MSKIIKLDSKGRFPLQELEGFIDITKVDSYSVKLNKDKTLTLKFYDKKKKLVKINAT